MALKIFIQGASNTPIPLALASFPITLFACSTRLGSQYAPNDRPDGNAVAGPPIFGPRGPSQHLTLVFQVFIIPKNDSSETMPEHIFIFSSSESCFIIFSILASEGSGLFFLSIAHSILLQSRQKRILGK